MRLILQFLQFNIEWMNACMRLTVRQQLAITVVIFGYIIVYGYSSRHSHSTLPESPSHPSNLSNGPKTIIVKKPKIWGKKILLWSARQPSHKQVTQLGLCVIFVLNILTFYNNNNHLPRHPDSRESLQRLQSDKVSGVMPYFSPQTKNWTHTDIFDWQCGSVITKHNNTSDKK